jgi:hypothetical protein
MKDQASRLSVLSRTVAAVFGGYVVATVASGALAGVLPLPRAEATLTMLMASFAVYTVAIVWVFAARSATTAWLGLLIPGLVCALILALLR